MLVLAITLAVLEGAIRKWVIGSEAGTWSYLAYFSKDLAFAAILLWPSVIPGPRPLARFNQWVGLGCGLFIVGGLLSCLRGLNWVGAVLTLRAGLVLPMLALLTARRLSGISLRHVALLVALCAAANCALGIVQSRLPPDHLLNRYVLAEAPVSAVESAVRATGTFSYITGLATLSCVGVWAGMVLLALARTWRDQLLAGVGIIAAFGCGLASVSRGPVVIGAAMLLAWVLLSRGGFAACARSASLWFPLLLLIFGLGFLPRFHQLGAALVERHETGEDTLLERSFGQLIEGVQAGVLCPFGAGLGTEQVAGNYAVSGTLSFSRYETQMPRLIVETGIPGCAGEMIICAGAILALQEARRKAGSEQADAALLATQLLLIPMFYGNVVFNHTASALAWMIVAAALGWSCGAPHVCREGTQRAQRWPHSHHLGNLGG